MKKHLPFIVASIYVVVAIVLIVLAIWEIISPFVVAKALFSMLFIAIAHTAIAGLYEVLIKDGEK